MNAAYTLTRCPATGKPFVFQSPHSSPVVPCRARWIPSRFQPNGGSWHLTVLACPFCSGKRPVRHFHGGGDGEWPDAGHRAADCIGLLLGTPHGYFLIVTEVISDRIK